MFSFKKNYYLYIDNTKTINLNSIKIKHKFRIIYRDYNNKESYKEIKNFYNKCKKKKIFFIIANNYKLFNRLQADGFYISAYNKKFKHLSYIVKKTLIIGSAHNYREIYLKKKQGCSEIVLSRIFRTDYSDKKSFLHVIKFNLISNVLNLKLVPLGGIREKNLNFTKNINCSSFCILSEIKKKPAIISRLF
tara:strand:+ start:78 stop:650 length:573 start_codon:yes stop_codon:yes gene_type:complete